MYLVLKPKKPKILGKTKTILLFTKIDVSLTRVVFKNIFKIFVYVLNKKKTPTKCGCQNGGCTLFFFHKPTYKKVHLL